MSNLYLIRLTVLAFSISKRLPKRPFNLFPLAILALICFLSPASGGDRPFNNAANSGATGLMEIPTARILGDGELRLGYAQALPYRWLLTASMGILPGVEMIGHYTEIANISGGLGPGFGSAKDEAVDLKFQIFPESRFFPAIAIGFNDLQGISQLFQSQYLVLNRQIFPFDFTLGVGRGRLGSGPLPDLFTFPSLDEFKIFGGVEWALNEWLHLIAEYNPIEYDKDKPSARGVPDGAESPFNAGVRVKVFPGLDLGLSWQRGDTLGLMGHLQFLLGAPLLPQRADPPIHPPLERSPFHEKDRKAVVESIHEAVRKAGFQDVSVYTDDKELTAEFTNGKYLSNQKAVGRVLRILLFHAPSDARKITTILKQQEIPLLEVSVRPEHLESYLLGKVPEDIFYKLVEVRTASTDRGEGLEDSVRTKEEKGLDFHYGIKPDFETYLNDPSGVFKYRPGVKPYVMVSPWKGGSIYARYDVPFYSNISSSNIPPPDAVRSDSWKYSDRDYSFDRLMLNQNLRISEKTFGRLTLGYLERMYAGTGGEILHFLQEGRLALGVEADWARKREPGSQFALLDFDTYSVLGNAYYRVPQLDMTLQAKYGRFLAEDMGWLFIASREYSTGVIFGAWYSITDTDEVPGEANKGYHHKGIFVSLPVRMFLNRDSRARYSYSVSPWTRDVAATISRWQDLYSLGADLMPAQFKEDLNEIKE